MSLSQRPCPTASSRRRYVLAIFLLLFLTHCAKEWRRPSPPKDIRRPVPPQEDVLDTNPKRNASQAIVQVGLRQFYNENYDQAERSFQEAINIDVTNPNAYFFLAKTKTKNKKYEEALGLLEKTESLAFENKNLLEQIDILREEVKNLQQETEETDPNYF